MFTSDEEPTDEQLELLMQDTREEVHKKNAVYQTETYNNIVKEYEKVKKYSTTCNLWKDRHLSLLQYQMEREKQP
jgi:hypothetical protein